MQEMCGRTVFAEELFSRLGFQGVTDVCLEPFSRRNRFRVYTGHVVDSTESADPRFKRPTCPLLGYDQSAASESGL